MPKRGTSTQKNSRWRCLFLSDFKRSLLVRPRPTRHPSRAKILDHWIHTHFWVSMVALGLLPDFFRWLGQEIGHNAGGLLRLVHTVGDADAPVRAAGDEEAVGQGRFDGVDTS